MSEVLSEKKQEVSKEPEPELANPEQVKKVIAEVIQSEFSGPIPPPSIIAGYEEVVSGAAIAGSLLGVTGIGSIVTAFLKTTRGPSKDTKEKK